MLKSRFPSAQTPHPDGLVAVSNGMNMELLIDAYIHGIFPWPDPRIQEVPWFSPDPRGIIYFPDFHVGKSLQKFLKKNPYEIRFNTDFASVIENCATAKRKDQPVTWITKRLIAAYIELFEQGLAYSVEAYEKGKLVGGVYGVCIGNFLSGESMFSSKDNASKVCLYFLKEKVQAQSSWMDIQMLTPVTEALGGIYLPREAYLEELSRCDFQLSRDLLFHT